MRAPTHSSSPGGIIDTACRKEKSPLLETVLAPARALCPAAYRIRAKQAPSTPARRQACTDTRASGSPSPSSPPPHPEGRCNTNLHLLDASPLRTTLDMYSTFTPTGGDAHCDKTKPIALTPSIPNCLFLRNQDTTRHILRRLTQWYSRELWAYPSTAFYACSRKRYTLPPSTPDAKL